MYEEHQLRNERELVSICAALGAARVGGPLSRAERRLLHRARGLSRPTSTTIEAVRQAVQRGADPLGESFTALRPQERRRATGAFYTPPAIVNAMLVWVLEHGPDRIVDPGCGSGRFVVAARRLGFKGELIAVDIDPVATLMTRAHCAAAHTGRVRVIHGDFLRLALRSRGQSRTAVVGNPPYVRHHALNAGTKRWARSMGARLGVKVSGLAGLHTLFILGAARVAQPGDVGCFITSAEWLAVRYGDAARGLLAGPLGCVRLDILDPSIAAFGGAMSTAAIIAWKVGNPDSVRIRHVHDIGALNTLSGGTVIGRDRLLRSGRWNELLKPARLHDDLVPLGSYARVHRGVATGANDFFVLSRDEATIRGLERHTRPCLVRAVEVITAGGVVRAGKLDRVLLDTAIDANDAALRSYLKEGQRHGVHERYLCAHRRPWWRVGGSAAPPIVATYMARQAPVFAVNPDRCQIVNVFHGIHFREPVDEGIVWALSDWLNTNREALLGGRTYQGGLRKFEPADLEAILVPPLHRLAGAK